MMKKQWVIFFLVFGAVAAFNFYNHVYAGTFVMLFIIGLGLLFLLFPTAHFSKKTETLLSYPEEDNSDIETTQQSQSLIYNGNELNFSEEELTEVLIKHLPFFSGLGIENKNKFLFRLKKFIKEKTFYVHDESGFKEMPILISATAIQFSLGLQQYLLPNFQNIHIYPEEFVGLHPTLRILEGNVSGNSINLSWKHFLEGFQFPGDGQNVGLHEFAHAYYYQYIEAGESVDKVFVSAYPDFDARCTQVLQQEQQPGNDLYSDYGLRNTQEFWAETIELFFEKPQQLKSFYPDLYDVIKRLLNQDMAAG